MSIVLGVYVPKKGGSVEQAFQSHMKGWQDENIKASASGLSRIIIGRVTKLDQGSALFTNYGHMTWNDRASMDAYLEAIAGGQMPPDAAFTDGIDRRGLFLVEEELIFENKDTALQKAQAIRFNVYSPKEGADPEDIFKFHVDVHAPHIMDTVAKVATPGLKRYVIGWVSAVSAGKPLFRNYVKMWWDDVTAMHRYLAELKVVKLPDGSPQSGPQGELGKQVVWHMNAFVDERVIFQSK